MNLILRLPPLLTLTALAVTLAAGADTPAKSGQGTLGLEWSFDDNVFRMDEGPLARVEAWVSTASLRWDHRWGTGLSAHYGMEVTTFGPAASSENHVRHLATLAGSGRRGAAAWEFSSQTIKVNGDDRSPVFNLSRSCFAISPPRERKDQWQNRTAVRWRQAWDATFLQASAGFTGYDLRTRAQSVAGVDNYVDRSDTAGGLDLGRTVAPGLSLAAGFREGYQDQDRDGGRTTDRSNHYRRLLVSVEGPLGRRVKIGGSVGPAFHRYRVASNGPSHLERLFADVALEVTLGAADTVLLSTKRSQAVASTGNVSSQEMTSTASWRHRFSNTWSASLSARRAGGIYDGATRDDVQKAGGAALSWRPARGPEITVTGGAEEANDHSVLHDAAREYHRRIASVSTQWTF